MSSSIVLVCAVLASLAAGVIVAYVVCVVMFTIFQGHVQQSSTRAASSVSVSTPFAES